MGQRLDLEISYKGERLANAYYHWSAYTDCALELTKKVIDTIRAIEEGKEGDKDMTPIEKAIYLLEKTGAGFTRNEIGRIIEEARRENVPEIRNSLFYMAKDRNKGLLAITEEGMDETEEWQEGFVSVDIGKNTVDFFVNYEIDEDEIEKEEKELGVKKEEVKLDYNFYNMSFLDFDDFYKSFLRSGEEAIYITKECVKYICIY